MKKRRFTEVQIIGFFKLGGFSIADLLQISFIDGSSHYSASQSSQLNERQKG